jgi:NAD(P)-dependent dehydrogenase (short-subunit alcohol dehydrogenase family)
LAPLVKTNLTGMGAIVTGGARGIGAAIAEALAANGAQVAIADIDGGGADAMAARLPRAIGCGMDVRDATAVQQTMNDTLAAFGRIDILVNNAGVNTLAHRVDIDAFPEEEWRRIIGVDLDGVFQVSRQVVPHMRALGGGRIVNIASVVGLVPLRLQCAFAAAKAGVINLTKAMALELGTAGIRVNGIAPGSVLTEVTRQLFYADNGSFHARVARLMQHIPLGRPGTPQEIANAALFLASRDSDCVHGHILTVDGGWTAGFVV